jgi:hypothetical protein
VVTTTIPSSQRRLISDFSPLPFAGEGWVRVFCLLLRLEITEKNKKKALIQPSPASGRRQKCLKSAPMSEGWNDQEGGETA